MPRRSKGARLWLQPARRDRQGRTIGQAVWCIRDGSLKRSTGCSQREAAEAERALAEYIASKYRAPRIAQRDPAAVKLADVVAIYADEVVHKHARPKETAARLERVLDFFGTKTLVDINRGSCEQYAAQRAGRAAARRELEDLRAAIRHHWQAGLCAALTPVVLPDRGETRERWLTRGEAARLLWAARRLRQRWRGKPSDRATAQHVARFILVGLYTGTRAGAICGAALMPTIGRGWVDTEGGVFYRRADGAKQTKKRQPTIRIPPRLLAHIRRWKRRKLSLRSVVEWNGAPVQRINKAFRSVRKSAGFGAEVVPHTLRHTAITWQAQLGVPVHEICGFFGITLELFERVYGHHHPDYQSNAVNALSRPRQFPDRYPATKRERTPLNVVANDGRD
jgi:integrase